MPGTEDRANSLNSGEFLLGDCKVRPSDGSLVQDGELVRLEPRVMEVLVEMAKRPGEVLTREELFTAVWGDTAVEDGTLSLCIYAIRRALGDDARNPRFIETIPKRGYRLIAEVEAGAADSRPEAPGKLPWLALGLLVLMVSIGLWTWLSRGLEGVDKTTQEAARHGQAIDISRTPSPAREAVPRLLVVPVAELTSDGDEQSFARGIASQVSRSLAAVPGWWVDTSEVATIEVLDTLANRAQADFVLACTTRRGDQQEVTLDFLVKRRADSHEMWRDPWQGELGDVLERIAAAVPKVIEAVGLRIDWQVPPATLSMPPTESEVRDLFIGKGLTSHAAWNDDDMRHGLQLLERVAEKYPNSAAAFAALAQAHAVLYSNFDVTEARKDLARAALDRALELDPDSIDSRLAEAAIVYRVEKDYATALTLYRQLARELPSSLEVQETIGYVLRRTGDVRGAIEKLELAARGNLAGQLRLLTALAQTYRASRKTQEAQRYYERVVRLDGSSPILYHQWGELALSTVINTGEISRGRELLEPSPVHNAASLTFYQVTFDLWERDFESALVRFGTKFLHRPLNPKELASDERFDRLRLPWVKAQIHRYLGDESAFLAQASLNEDYIRARLAKKPEYPFLHAYLGISLAQQMRSAEAKAASDLAQDLIAYDRFVAPQVLELRVIVDTLLGEREVALEKLRVLLDLDYNFAITTTQLCLDPFWSPLLGEDFDQLLISVPLSQSCPNRSENDSSVRLIPREEHNSTKGEMNAFSNPRSVDHSPTEEEPGS